MYGLVKFAATLILCWSVSPKTVNAGEISPNFHVIGTADGKTYFVEEGNMTWFEAKKYCEDMKMQLGSTTTGNQIRLWVDSYNPTYFANHYWTAARDRLQSSQFVWDTTFTELVHMDGLGHNGTPKSCLYYRPGPGVDHGFEIASCTDKVGVICEI